MKLLAGACASKEAKKKESYRLNKVPLGWFYWRNDKYDHK
jgi:hypothetical protein